MMYSLVKRLLVARKVSGGRLPLPLILVCLCLIILPSCLPGFILEETPIDPMEELFNNCEKIQVLPTAYDDADYRLVFFPAGYTAEQLADDGPFMENVRRVTELFISCEPLSRYSRRISSTACLLPSDTEGIPEEDNDGFLSIRVCKETSGVGKPYYCSYDRKAALSLMNYYEPIGDTAEKTLTIVICNTDQYVSVTSWLNNRKQEICMLTSVEIEDKEEGDIFVIHEIVGHGFGRLADEYYFVEESPDKSYIDNIQKAHSEGFYLNISTTPDTSLWESLGVDPSEIEIYEGGKGYYGKGLWRSSETSIMNEGPSMEFNAVSKRILEMRCEKIFGN